MAAAIRINFLIFLFTLINFIHCYASDAKKPDLTTPVFDIHAEDIKGLNGGNIQLGLSTNVRSTENRFLNTGLYDSTTTSTVSTRTSTVSRTISVGFESSLTTDTSLRQTIKKQLNVYNGIDSTLNQGLNNFDTNTKLNVNLGHHKTLFGSDMNIENTFQRRNPFLSNVNDLSIISGGTNDQMIKSSNKNSESISDVNTLDPPAETTRKHRKKKTTTESTSESTIFVVTTANFVVTTANSDLNRKSTTIENTPFKQFESTNKIFNPLTSPTDYPLTSSEKPMDPYVMISGRSGFNKRPKLHSVSSDDIILPESDIMGSAGVTPRKRRTKSTSTSSFIDLGIGMEITQPFFITRLLKPTDSPNNEQADRDGGNDGEDMKPTTEKEMVSLPTKKKKKTRKQYVVN